MIEVETPQYLELIQGLDNKKRFTKKEIETIDKGDSSLEKVQKIFSIEVNRKNLKKKVVIINFSKSVLKNDPYHPKVHL